MRSFTLPEVGVDGQCFPMTFPPGKGQQKKSGLWPWLGQEVREQTGRPKEPSAGLLYSQAVKATTKGGPKTMMPAKNKGQKGPSSG